MKTKWRELVGDYTIGFFLVLFQAQLADRVMSGRR